MYVYSSERIDLEQVALGDCHFLRYGNIGVALMT